MPQRVRDHRHPSWGGKSDRSAALGVAFAFAVAIIVFGGLLSGFAIGSTPDHFGCNVGAKRSVGTLPGRIDRTLVMIYC